MVPAEVLEHPISKEQVIARFLALDGDTRFRDFAGKIEINEYGDLLVNAASRLHVVVQTIEVKSDSNTLKDMREKRDELLAMGANEIWFIFPERRQVEFYGQEGKRGASQFGVDLTGFWNSY